LPEGEFKVNGFLKIIGYFLTRPRGNIFQEYLWLSYLGLIFFCQHIVYISSEYQNHLQLLVYLCVCGAHAL